MNLPGADGFHLPLVVPLGSFSSRVGPRDKDGKASGAPAGVVYAAEPDRALVFGNDSLADPQSQAGSLGGFGGEKRLKQTLGIFRLDS